MGKSATAKKRARKAEQQAALRRRVYIALPEEFVDSRGEAWSVTRSTGLEELGLDEVLCHTLRVGPYDNSAETFRGLELQQEIQALDEDADCIMLWEADFDWMVEHFPKDNSFWHMDSNRFRLSGEVFREGTKDYTS